MPNAIRAICNSFRRDMSIPSVSDRSAFVRSESETYLSSKRPAATSVGVHASVDAAGWAGRSIHPGASRRVGVRLQYAQRNDDGGGHGSVVDPCNHKFAWAAGRGPSRDAWVRKNKTAYWNAS